MMIGSSILHYKIISKLGEGGMGIVYLAEDTKLNRKVALKFLPHFISADSDQRERFKIEARAAASLNHNNIATIYSIEQTESEMFIVLEFIDGVELKQKIQSGPIPVNEASEIALQISRGLENAHSKGIVHRDIKSANIMISNDGIVKIMDFGLAKIEADTQITKAGFTAGTIAYMSPEQSRGDEVDHRTDIWSFGILLYEMLTGKQPFRGEYEQAVVYSIMNEDAEPVSRLTENYSPVMEQIITSCLKKDPAERYQSFSEIINCLRENETSKVKQIPAADNKKPGTFKRRTKTLIISLILLIILSAILFSPVPAYVSKFLGKSSGFTQQHLSILPLVNYGDQSVGRAFSDGLVETMTSKITQLGQFNRSLWIVPSSEVLTNKIRTPGEAKELFGINLAVTGSIQNFKDLIRLTLNLVNTENMRQLNSTVLEVKTSEISELHNLCLIKLIEMLDLELNPKTHEIISEGNTNVPEAYQYFLQGRGFLQRYENLDNINSAIRLFSLAVNKDSLYSIAHASLAEAYWLKYEATKDHRLIETAVRESEKAYRLDSTLAAVNVTSGLINSGIGKKHQAVKYFTKALDVDPMNAAAHRGLANCYETLGQVEKAEKTFRKAIDLKPDYWAGYNALGSFYYKHGRYEDAVNQFKKVIELTPDNARGYNNLGGIYYLLENWDYAREMFEKSLSISKSYSVASNLGTLNYIQKSYSDAARMYKMALEINDKDYIVWGNLASALYWIPGKREEAFATYKKAIGIVLEEEKINPDNAELLSNLAAYYSMTGDISNALKFVQKSLELAPDDAQIMFRAGTTYEQLGERKKALFYLENAIKNGYSKSEIQNQPDLTGLLSDQNFKEILEKYQ